MTKTAFALAALLAGMTMTTAAKADAVRLGFGFPLGSFVAHSNENYSRRDYRRAERPQYVRREVRDEAPARKVTAKVRKPVTEVAEASMKPAPAPKRDDKLASDPATTTVVEKTPIRKSDAAPVVTASTNDVPKAEKPAADTPSMAKADAETTAAAVETKHICRRYSPAIAALVDVPCE